MNKDRGGVRPHHILFDKEGAARAVRVKKTIPKKSAAEVGRATGTKAAQLPFLDRASPPEKTPPTRGGECI